MQESPQPGQAVQNLYGWYPNVSVSCRAFRAGSQILANGMGGLSENGLINLKNKSHSVTAQVNIPEGSNASYPLDTQQK